MSGNVVIAGFASTDKVPGAYGEVVYGAGGQSAANIPLLLLLVGLKTSSGNLTNDTEVRQVFSLTDIDAAAGAGGELATMAYDALSTAPGAPIYLLAPTAAGGATAATAFLAITGPATGSGTINVRVGGVVVGTQVASGDASTAIATNIANNVTGWKSGRLPISASASGSVVTFTCKTSGVRGMQHVLFADTSQIASGVTATWYGTWTTLTGYTSTAPSVVVPTTPNGFYYKCTTTGTAAVSQPTFPTTIGTTVSDGTAVWTCWGTTVTSGAAQVGLTLGNSTGTETYTNALAAIVGNQYDRIALAANDSVSLGVWKTQVDAQATVLTGLLQHAVFATNGTLAAAQSLAQTTLNDQRFQGLWELSSETHPARIAAAAAALAVATEQNDPDASYDAAPLATVVPQSQKADWPVHGTLVSALNTGVTPLFTYGDGLARIVRSITTHCLTSSNPDYSTLDTSQARCPDYVLKDLKLYFVTRFQPNNPRAQDNVPSGQRPPPTGVAYPDLWSSAANGRLQQMFDAKNPGTCPPIIVPGSQPVTSSWDPNANRIMSAVPINVAPGNHQIGISVRQVA